MGVLISTVILNLIQDLILFVKVHDETLSRAQGDALLG